MTVADAVDGSAVADADVVILEAEVCTIQTNAVGIDLQTVHWSVWTQSLDAAWAKVESYHAHRGEGTQQAQEGEAEALHVCGRLLLVGSCCMPHGVCRFCG